MSFRRRLTLFFVVIVVLPMVALGAIVVQLAGSAETGKADAGLSAALETALGVYDEDQSDAEEAGRRPRRTPSWRRPCAPVTAPGSRRRLRGCARRRWSRSPCSTAGRRSRRRATARRSATAELKLEQDGRSSGALVASTTTASDFARRVREFTGREATVSDEHGTAATTMPVGDVELPAAGSAATVDVDGEELRAASAELGGPAGDQPRVTLFGEIESAGFAADRPLVAAALVAFFVVALVFAVSCCAPCRGRSPRCSRPRGGSGKGTSAASCRSRATTRWPVSPPSSTR